MDKNMLIFCSHYKSYPIFYHIPGKFNEGVREGPAEWITKGYSYKGFFRNDQPYGKGKFTFENGCEQHGFHKVRWRFFKISTFFGTSMTLQTVLIVSPKIQKSPKGLHPFFKNQQI